MRRGSVDVGDIKPIKHPNRHFPSVDWSPLAASDHLAKAIEPLCARYPLFRWSFSTLSLRPSACHGWENNTHFGAVAYCQPFASRTSSSMRYTSRNRTSSFASKGIWARGRGNLTQFPQRAPAQFNVIRRRGPPSVLPTTPGPWVITSGSSQSPPGSTSQRNPSAGPIPRPRVAPPMPRAFHVSGPASSILNRVRRAPE